VARGFLAATIGAALLAGTIALACGSSGPAAATATPRPSALAPGTHTSLGFKPALTFTVPDGWYLKDDGPAYLGLVPVASDLVGIHVFRDPTAASQDPTCPETSAPGIGTTSVELSAWIRGRPGFVVGAPKLVTVGGLRGTQLDVHITPGWTPSCSFANGSPTVPLFVRAGSFYWVVAGNEQLSLFLLDVPGGGTVVVDIDAFDGTQMDALLSSATPIVGTFAFAAQ
jgi:hypothetical protein